MRSPNLLIIPERRPTVVIPGHAEVTAYVANDASQLSLEAAAMDIYLLIVRQGSVRIVTSFIPHPLELVAHEAVFLAYPRDQWTFHLMTDEAGEYVVAKMEVHSFHKILNPAKSIAMPEAGRMQMRDLMRILPVTPAIQYSMEQLLYHKLQPTFQAIFAQAKFLEIFSLLMESAFGQPMDACPVAMSAAIEQKLNLVRRHIIDHIADSPDPDQLALIYDLPRQTLKEGFRYKYGKTLHQFQGDHKLERALEILSAGEMLVKEVAFHIGYQNPSHFIAAFKKKFGFTPKQFLKKEMS